MHSVKLTVLIDERVDDVDMEVRLVSPHAAPASATVSPLRARHATAHDARLDDEYTLGGYAGI